MRLFSDVFVEDFRKELARFFNIDILNIPIYVCDSIEEFKAFKYADYIVAVSICQPNINAIFLLNEELSGRSHDDWVKIVKHEMVHLFFVTKYHSGNPKWLNEGLAMYLSGQTQPQKDFTIHDLLNYTDKMDKDGYIIGYNAVKKILEDRYDCD